GVPYLAAATWSAIRTRWAARSVSRHSDLSDDGLEAEAGTAQRSEPARTAVTVTSKDRRRMVLDGTCEDPRVSAPFAISEVLSVLERACPPALAESWDAVGLVCGDPAEPVSRVLFCVDPVAETVDEAVDLGAQLIVAHHPLLLRG